MCCSYYVKEKTNYDAFLGLGLVPKLEPRWAQMQTLNPGSEALMIVAGDLQSLSGQDFPGPQIQPSSSDPQILPAISDPQILPALGIWGFPGKNGGLIINARAETVLVRPTFAGSAENRRCVLPAACFYEWDAEKNRVTFTDPEREVIYLAGVWKLIEDRLRFVVLTTAANASMAPVHDRMPLMMDAKDVEPWLFSRKDAERLLRREMPLLRAARENEQMRLF